MNGIEKLEEQARKFSADQDKRAKSLEQIRNKLTEIEKDIDAAIDADDVSKVEKLTWDKKELQNRLDAQIAIFHRKAKDGVSRESAAEVWNAEAAKQQKQIDSLSADMESAIREVAKRAYTLCEAVNAARDLRRRALIVVNDQEPYTLNAGNTKFRQVYGNYEMLRALTNVPAFINAVRSINPDAMKTIESAMRDPSNPFFRPKRTQLPEQAPTPSEDKPAFAAVIPGNLL